MTRLLLCALLTLLPFPAAAQLDTMKRWRGLERTQREWTGDLGGMLERRQVRILVVTSRTFYFVDKGTQRGISYPRLPGSAASTICPAARSSSGSRAATSRASGT